MYQPDNDIDFLLKRASEDYPLKEGEDRWSEINFRLRPSSSARKGISNIQRAILAIVFLLSLLLNSLYFSDLVKTNHAGTGKTKKSGQLTAGSSLDRVIAKKIIQPSHNESAENFYNKAASYTDKVFVIKEQGTGKVNVESVPVFHLANTGEDELLSREIIIQEPVATANIDSLISKTESESGKGEDNQEPNHKKFYYGAVAAINISNVKNSAVKNAGFSVGLTGGLRISKRSSVESGILFSKRMYKSRGDNFDMTEMKTSLPDGTELMELYGCNYILEFPLGFKYNFLSSKSHNIFSTAGISSFLLLKEKNKYHLRYNGEEQVMKGNYNHNSKYFAATANLSIGYEKKLERSSLRFEPYAQIPLRGLGIGILPVSSYGLRVTITR